MTDLGPTTLDQRRRPGSTAGPHQTRLARTRTATTASPWLPKVKFNEPREKPHGLSIPRLLPTPRGGNTRRGRHTARSGRATRSVLGPTQRTCAWQLAKSRVEHGLCGGNVLPRALECDAHFSHGRFHHPHFTDEEAKVETVKRLHRTVQVRPKSPSIPSSVQRKIENSEPLIRQADSSAQGYSLLQKEASQAARRPRDTGSNGHLLIVPRQFKADSKSTILFFKRRPAIVIHGKEHVGGSVRSRDFIHTPSHHFAPVRPNQAPGRDPGAPTNLGGLCVAPCAWPRVRSAQGPRPRPGGPSPGLQGN